MMTDDELKAIRERAAKATPGTWEKGINCRGEHNSREDVPALLAEIERLKNIVDIAVALNH